MSAKKPKVVRLENVPVVCLACGQRTGTKITLMIEQPAQWKITGCKVDLTINGTHGNCPVLRVSGAIQGVHGPPDQTHLTKKGSRTDIWDHDKKRRKQK